MTAPNGPIVFNADTGSDVAASGLGPATAVTGSGASTTGSSAVVTGIDTTGVTAGDLLWVQSSSGRQFSIIATVDSGSQVTCDDVFANTESGRTWAIGGKRATFENANSRLIFLVANYKTGWEIETETNQTIDSALSITASGTRGAPVSIAGSGGLRTITQTANAFTIEDTATSPANLRLKSLKFANSNSTKTNAWAVRYAMASMNLVVADCEIGDATHRHRHAFGRAGGSQDMILFMVDSRVHHLTDKFSEVGGAAQTSYHANGCTFSDNAAEGFGSLSTGWSHGASVVGCIFARNGGEGFRWNSGGPRGDISIANSIFHDNASQGIYIGDTDSGVSINNNIITNNSHGIRLPASPFVQLKRNAYRSNTSGNVFRDATASGDGDAAITLTADPFVDAAAGDFNINDTAGGGALLRAATVVMP